MGNALGMLARAYRGAEPGAWNWQDKPSDPVSSKMPPLSPATSARRVLSHWPGRGVRGI